VGTFQPLNVETPAALAHRLRCATWRLPAGDWQIEGETLGVRHGAAFTPVARLPEPSQPAFAQALVELLEGVPGLLELVAPMQPTRPGGKPGAKYRKHQDRVIEAQQQEILALREELSALHEQMKTGQHSAGREDSVRGQEQPSEATASSSAHVLEANVAQLRRNLQQAARDELVLRDLIKSLLRPPASQPSASQNGEPTTSSSPRRNRAARADAKIG
jgi:hypothetical protein